jgi:SAM-dependent methyltransferase
MSAVQNWKAMIQAEHAQSERMRAAITLGDYWQDYASTFKDDPYRSGDPLLDRLLQEISSHDTVIDVGAGGGRMALPLALHCQRVVAVEPSPSMASVLEQQARHYGVENVFLVQALWEEAEIQPADITLCCHVVYTIQAIEPFLRKLEAHARKRVLIVLYQTPPQSQIYPLWKEVHGEERLPLPSLPQLEQVLLELGINARVEMLPAHPPRGFDNLEEAGKQLSSRLYLAEGSEKKAKLRNLLPERLEEMDGTFWIKGAEPLRPSLVSWPPRSR